MVVRTAGAKALQCLGCPLVPDDGEAELHRKHVIVAGGRALASERGWEWVSVERMMRDVRELLLPKLPAELRGVAGCPRSAMAAATYLATVLHLPLYTADPRAGLQPLGHQGTRSRVWGWGRELTGPVLVVEDSTYGGGSLAGLRRKIGGDGVYAALYHRPLSRGNPDLWARELESPHFFEWHCFNSGHMSGNVTHPCLQAGSVLDMDGIVCRDPTVSDDDEEGYAKFVAEAPQLWVPRAKPCRAILTARLERHRTATEEWLRRHGARYDRLVMMDVPTHRDRGDVAAWKARELAAVAPSMYFESSPLMARRIRELWGGTVLCPPASLVLPGDEAVRLQGAREVYGGAPAGEQSPSIREGGEPEYNRVNAEA
jgi:orotate phosphoribosyltransferase